MMRVTSWHASAALMLVSKSPSQINRLFSGDLRSRFEAASIVYINICQSVSLVMSVLKYAFAVLFAVICLGAVGCGESRPDPRDNPDFNEAGMNDPSVYKMD